MKKRIFALAALVLSAGLFVLSCTNITNYATTTISSVDVTAKAYSGVNILTWKAVKDAGSYSVYKTVVDGKNETLVLSQSKDTYYCDTDIEEGCSYKYRVIAHPVNDVVHDAGQKEISLKAKKSWAPKGTSFSQLAQYESDSGDETLDSWSIQTSRLADSGSTIRVKFPVKPYAMYTVQIGQKNGAATGASDVTDYAITINGFEYSKTATVDVDAVYPGEKEITVTATPYNILYASEIFTPYDTIEIFEIEGVTKPYEEISVKWTNYDSWNKIATVRVQFVPVSFQGQVFELSDYAVYRAVKTNKTNSGLSYKRAYDYIEKVDGPWEGVATETSLSGSKVYYTTDSVNIADVYSVTYYVVLTRNGRITSGNETLRVPGLSDADWNFTPDTGEELRGTYIENLTLDKDGYLTVTAYSNYNKPKFTYDYFSTYNQALVAVEGELYNEVPLKSTSPDYSYYYKGTSDSTLTSTYYGYYAFRLVEQQSDGTEVAHKIIAKLKQSGNGYGWGPYYLEIEDRSSRPSGYNSVSAPYIDSTPDVEFDRTNYNSITLHYYSSNYNQEIQYYNIYRARASSYDDYYNFQLIDTVEAVWGGDFYYTDKTDELKEITLDNYVIYKIEAVGRYNVSESEAVSVLRLSAPELSNEPYRIYYDNNNQVCLDWIGTPKAAEYRIYYAHTDKLDENTLQSFYKTYNTRYDEISYDYYATGCYYVIKAVGYDRYNNEVESKFSEPIYVPKRDIPTSSIGYVSLNSYDSYNKYYNSKISYSLSTAQWVNYHDYTLLRIEDASNMSEYAIKTLLEQNYEGYKQESLSEYQSSASQKISTESAAYGKAVFYAILTTIIDPVSGQYCYAVGDVKKLSWPSKMTVTAGEDNTYTFSWDAIPGAVIYWVYYRESDSSSIDDFYSSDNANGTSWNYTKKYSDDYELFCYAEGRDNFGNVVGYTTIASPQEE